MENNSYLTIIDEILPRMLGLIDRDRDSKTYGCCDRNFWMYKITDFSSGIIQQCSLTLSLLYSNSDCFETGYLYLRREHKDYYKDIAIAVNRWTLKTVNHGSLDEYYFNEKSFPATVFTAYALLKSSIILDDQYVLKSDKLNKIANFLCKKKPSLAANQDVAAAAYLWLYYNKINKSDKYLIQINNLLNREEFGGEFNEYMGFDFGYATVTVNYLSYMLDDGFSDATKYIKKLSNVICCTATSSPVVSGNIFSRNTSYYLPYAIEKIISLYPEKSKKLKNLSFSSVMSILDDRYMMHYFTPSIAYSAFTKKDTGIYDENSKDMESVSIINQGGVVCITYEQITFIISLIKSGVFSVSSGKNHYCNNGYRLINNGNIYSSSNITSNLGAHPVISRDGDVITITTYGVFSKYKTLYPSPFKTVILRLISIFGSYLNLLFKRILITTPQILNESYFTRKVVVDLKQDSVVVKDLFDIPKNSTLHMSPNFSSRLVPSAKFYQESDLSENTVELDLHTSNIVTEISLIGGNISTVYNTKHTKQPKD